MYVQAICTWGDSTLSMVSNAGCMLSMALRSDHVQTRIPGEFVRPHEIHFKLHEAEVPFKNKVHLQAPPSRALHAVMLGS